MSLTLVFWSLLFLVFLSFCLLIISLGAFLFFSFLFCLHTWKCYLISVLSLSPNLARRPMILTLEFWGEYYDRRRVDALVRDGTRKELGWMEKQVQ